MARRAVSPNQVLHYFIREEGRQELHWCAEERCHSKESKQHTENIAQLRNFENWLKHNQIRELSAQYAELRSSEQTSVDCLTPMSAAESAEKIIQALHGYRYEEGELAYYLASWTE